MKALSDVLGKELRIVKLKDGTVISKVYECESCSGSGTYEVYYNEFDIFDEECKQCNGTGEIEIHE